MKKYIYRFTALLAAVTVAAGAVSCDSFLDRQEDENMTFEKIWSQMSYTRQYFFNCMGYLPRDFIDAFGSYGNESLEHTWGATDEGTLCWTWTTYQSIIFGSWNASSGVAQSNFDRYYQAIRDCNIFLPNVLLCSDPQADPSDLQRWYYCVRWVRAYYYFLLMRDYGPIFLMGDELIDPGASLASLATPRNTWEECVEYVVSEMEYCAAHLPETHASNYYGLPTKGAALAVISELTLYNARDLFNGNSLYRSVVNPDGTALFPREYDAKKWLTAAQAAKEVIDLGIYSLYRDESNDPMLNYYGILREAWNSELIFTASGYQGPGVLSYHTIPGVSTLGGSAYGGYGPTQQQVDAYAMANGRYPITGYEDDGTPKIDNASGYPSKEFSKTNFTNPYMMSIGADASHASGNWPIAFKDREPRFYVSVFWSDSDWKYETNYLKISFADGGNANSSHNHPKSGYMVNRYVDHSVNSFNGAYGPSVTFPTIRLGEIYLNYIEAVLECEKNGVSGAGVDHATAMALWDELRDRSGMGPITEAYPGASIAQLIDLVRRERRVELAFEGKRYYDTRTWMIATETDNGPMYGMDGTALTSSPTETPDAFWNRTVFETRVFRNNHYLFPFPQRELDRNKQLTQNYGW